MIASLHKFDMMGIQVIRDKHFSGFEFLFYLFLFFPLSYFFQFLEDAINNLIFLFKSPLEFLKNFFKRSYFLLRSLHFFFKFNIFIMYLFDFGLKFDEFHLSK